MLHRALSQAPVAFAPPVVGGTVQTATLVRRQHIEHMSQSMHLLCLHRQLAST